MGNRNWWKIGFIFILIIMLTGCASVKNGVDKTNAQSVSNTTTSNNTLESTSEKGYFEKGYYDYEGTLNNTSIHLSIYPLDKNIVGSYFYDSQRTEIKLKGKAGEKDIVIYEYNESGEKTGIFKGSVNTDDEIKGTWSSADGKRSYPFKLTLSSYFPGAEYGKRYATAVSPSTSDRDVEKFVCEIQGYIINDNKEQLAQLIIYPITVKIDDKYTKIQNKDDFIKNYDKIFYYTFKQEISNAFTKYLFANWRGIMFGENLHNIWINEIDSKLMITTVNN